MATEHIEPILQTAFGDSLRSWKQVGAIKVMGFSGASISNLSCTLGGVDAVDASQAKVLECVLKQTSKQLPSLPLEADAGKRLRAERTDFSYASECCFLRERSNVLNSRECRVPKLFHAGESGDSFSLLMEAFSETDGWEQKLLIPQGAHTRAVLRWLARFHATFLPVELGGGGIPVATAGSWDIGSHMALEKRPASELGNLAATLEAFCKQFADTDPYFESIGAKSVGPRLQSAAESIAWCLRPAIGGVDGGAKIFTVTHGDFKQANMFFRDTEASAGEAPDVAVIDWQWTGAGVTATDIFFICVMALSDEAVENYRTDVLKVYHEELSAVLGSEQSYPFEQLEREFKLAGLDFMRWITGARFVGFTPEKMKAANDTVDINRGMWIRSMRRMVWLWQRAQEFLDGVESLVLPS